jgi:hypothetical protein
MLEKLRQLWRSNYVRLLEEKVSCLRAENGALMNSLLGTAGLDAQLAQTLATLAAEKRTIVTPAQIIHDLPSQLPLPSPIVLQSAPASPDSPSPKTNAVIPAEDLKPLYDFTIDCKACQAKLSTAQADLTDERQKATALTRERDDALRIARGGSILRRITRAAKWFAIGAAAGAVAAKAAH